MTKQSERIPVEEEYIRALGRATYNFTYLEWGIVWLIETLKPGFLDEVSELTSGQIGQRFSRVVQQLDDAESDKVELVNLASCFQTLVKERNKLMHGNPFTAPDGEQRLLYKGKHGQKDWTIELISDFSDRVASASIEAAGLFHNGRHQAYKENQCQ